MKCEYVVRTDFVRDEESCVHMTYGIELLADSEVIKSYPDIFAEREDAEAFATLCNNLDLSPVHFDDVIEDVIT